MRCTGQTASGKDRGYAWLVLVMSFLSHFAHYGFSMAVVGNLTIVQKEYFNIDLQQSSLIGSIHISIVFLLAPFASVMIKKLGVQVSQLIGGTLTILSLGLSSLSTEAWHAFLLYSFLAGFGICLTYCGSCDILPKYFDKRLNLAFSFSAVGAFVGNSVWPVLSQCLFDQYGYSKSMGIMAAFQVIHIIAGISFFEPNFETEGIESGNDQDVARDSKFTDSNYNVQAEGYVNHALDHSEQVDLGQSGKTITSEEDEVNVKPTTNNLKETFVYLSKSLKVWLFLVSGFSWTAEVVASSVLLNDFIVDKIGISVEEAAFGITLMGTGKLFGCICLTLTSSLDYDRLIVHTGSVAVFSTATLLFAFANSKVMFYVLTCVCGVGNAVAVATILPVVNDMCGPHAQSILFGFSLMADGIGGLAAPPVFVYISTLAGKQYSLISASCVGFFGTACLLVQLILTIRSRRISSN